MLKVTDVAPVATGTGVGAAATAALLLVIVTVLSPPLRAGLLNVTVTLAVPFLKIWFGVMVMSLANDGAATIQNHISKSYPRRPSPLGRRRAVLVPLAWPKAVPSRNMLGSLFAQIQGPLRVTRTNTPL